QGHVGLIRPLSQHFCGSCNRLRLTADGFLKACLHSEEETLLRDLTGDDLKAAILQVVDKKPKAHHLNEQGVSDTPRFMNQIGG
ncbi:MAG TPA: GTP 3',8-cyclase MoaA, partial [Clostridiaceae bacterium]|nr:GTP 3',8-cyclase MoaA [Clostridiaceae bacterium]